MTTDQELKDLVVSLAESQKKTDEQMRKTDEKLNQISEMLGGVSNNQGIGFFRNTVITIFG